MAVFNILTHQLITALKASLLRISTTWLQFLITEKLIFQQRSFARQYSPDLLEQLDFAALFRVADQNLYELSQQLNLDKTARNWLKEVQTIHSRWDHAPSVGLDDDIRCCDSDPIERLRHAFSVSHDKLEQLLSRKKTFIPSWPEAKKSYLKCCSLYNCATSSTSHHEKPNE